jgi:hypothetical protein
MTTNAPSFSEPSWLRGAYVGALVVLPVGAVSFAVASLVTAWRRSFRVASRFAAAALACAIATQTAGIEAFNAGYPVALALRPAAFAGSAAIATAESPGIAPTAASVDQGQTDIDRRGASLSKTTYDVGAEAAALGNGVAPAFAFVRDHIRFESYSGMMRGYDETFTAHAGNAIDRTILLGHFLAAQKIPVRIAVGKLTPELAEQLFAHMFDAPAPDPSASAQPGSVSAHDPLTTSVFARAHRDDAAIEAALGATHTPLASYDHARILSEIEDHAWLQAQVDGKWIDLDTAFPQATPGRAYAAVTNTYGDVQPETKQHVTIRVLADYVDTGTLSTETALEETFDAPDLVDQQIFLGTATIGASMMGSKGGPVGPVLMIAGQSFAGKPIGFEPVAAPTSPFGAAAGAFGGTAAPSTPSAAVGKQFVAERLEIETDTPDGTKRVVSRTLVDRAGDAWRASSNHDPAALHALPRNTNGLLATQTTYNLCFSAGDHNLIAFSEALSAIAHGFSPAASGASPPPLTAQQSLWPVAMRDLAWTVFSDHVIVPAVDATPGLRFYPDTPRVFIFADSPNAAGTGMVLESDLRADTLRGVARDPKDADAVGARKRWFGVLEGAMEHELIARQSGDPARATVTSTSSLLGSDGAIVASGDSHGDAVAATPETASRIATALATGDTLVIPRAVLRGGPSGWWQIATATGDTRAVLGDDLNGSSSIGNWTKGTSFNGARASGGGYTWGPRGSLPINSPYSPNAPPVKKGGGGGEIGEYVAMLQSAIDSASAVERLASAVLGAIGVGAAVLGAIAPV